MDYKLDLSTWRCGGREHSAFLRTNCSLGVGETQMLNAEGYSCCLGQFASQKGVDGSDLIDQPEPHLVARRIGKLYDRAFVRYCKDAIQRTYLTQLASECIAINDNPETTVERKIELLRAALARKGHTLTVIGGE